MLHWTPAALQRIFSQPNERFHYLYAYNTYPVWKKLLALFLRGNFKIRDPYNNVGGSRTKPVGTFLQNLRRQIIFII